MPLTPGKAGKCFDADIILMKSFCPQKPGKMPVIQRVVSA